MDEVLRTHTVLWAAGVMASDLGSELVRETGRLRLSGFFAWMTWLLIHIYYLSSFRNRLLVLVQWPGRTSRSAAARG